MQVSRKRPRDTVETPEHRDKERKGLQGTFDEALQTNIQLKTEKEDHESKYK